MTATVYTTPTCPYCKMVKEYLYQRGVSFVEKDVSRDQAAAQHMVHQTGQQGVPVTEIDGQYVVGFDRARLEHLLQQMRPPTLGVSVADASRHAPSIGRGAYIGNVRPASPAHQAGLRKRDVIIEVAEHPIPDAATLIDLTPRISPGQQIRVRFVRNGQTRETIISM